MLIIALSNERRSGATISDLQRTNADRDRRGPFEPFVAPPQPVDDWSHAQVVGRIQRAGSRSGNDLGALRFGRTRLRRGGGDRLGGHLNIADPVTMHAHPADPKLGGNLDIGGDRGDQLGRALELGRIDADGAVASGHAVAYRATVVVPTRFLSVEECTLPPPDLAARDQLHDSLVGDQRLAQRRHRVGSALNMHRIDTHYAQV